MRAVPPLQAPWTLLRNPLRPLEPVQDKAGPIPFLGTCPAFFNSQTRRLEGFRRGLELVLHLEPQGRFGLRVPDVPERPKDSADR